jgi:hypothetical protein
MNTLPPPQRITDLPARDYHAMLQRQSCSMLKAMLQSPAHYLQRLLHAREPTSPSMEFGRLVHLLVLEPMQLAHSFEIVVERVRGEQRTRDGRSVITEVQLHAARGLADKILATTYKGRPLYRFVQEGACELTLLFDDPVTATACRSRLDLWHPELIFDLKTTRHACVEGFQRSALQLHYDLQAYMYCLADAVCESRAAARPFVFIAAESSPPHTVHVLQAGESFLANGQQKYQRAISLVRGCTTTDYWPDGGTAATLEIEPWQAYEPRAVCGEGA